MTTPLPALFVGHGSPMNALQRNRYTEGWSRLAADIPRPAAILAVSAHWYVPGAAVTVAAKPRTIHDFGGFPRELFQVQYPAPGDPELARHVQQLLGSADGSPGSTVALDERWGLDHGTWSVLCHMYPHADVPVVQLAIDETQSGAFHFEVGRRLAPLRDENVLVLGSGNLVHNLHTYAWGRHTPEPFDWAVRFESEARRMMSERHYGPLIEYEQLGRDAHLSIPTPDHYLPLLYVLGTTQPDDTVSFPVEGVDGGSISMLSVRVG
jgi:4,5-DOPA dioxygenase extradiol